MLDSRDRFAVVIPSPAPTRLVGDRGEGSAFGFLGPCFQSAEARVRRMVL